MDWRTIPDMSPSYSASRLNTFEKKMKRSLNTFSTLKLIEACLESVPQLILLLSYFTVSLFDTDAISVSENDIFKENDLEQIPELPELQIFSIIKRNIDAFFLVNFTLSFLTLITTVVSSVSMMKGDQHGIKQKVVLYISYTFQICS